MWTKKSHRWHPQMCPLIRLRSGSSWALSTMTFPASGLEGVMQPADSSLPLTKALSCQCPIACASDVAVVKFRWYNMAPRLHGRTLA